MKYGLLVYKETDNIGDDIQAYATERFLPTVDYYVDRESLNTFIPQNGERIAVIMNAWYMYNKYNWPPSPYVIPYFISIHISKSDFFLIGEDFLDAEGQNYLKQYEPIGCRDNSTVQMLEKKKIQSFFSGCMTLTIEKSQNVKKTDLIYCVDVASNIVEKLKEEVGSDKLKQVTHDVEVVSEENFSWTERRKRVKDLLEEYQGAKCVITTRLHCALPCLALGTPVLLIYKDEEYFKTRMENYLPLLHHCTEDEFLEGMQKQYDFENPPQNSKDFLEMRQELIRGVEHFLQKIATTQENATIPQEYWYRQLCWQSCLLKQELPKLREMHDRAWLVEQLTEKCKWQDNEIEWLHTENEGTKKWYEEREKWYKDREQEIKWLNEKIEGTEKWYKEREKWYEEQIEKNESQIKCQIGKMQEQKQINEDQIRRNKEEIDKLRLENKSLQQNCESLIQSKAYKIGMIVLWLPLKIKKLFKFE